MNPGDVCHIAKHPECGHIRFAGIVHKGDEQRQREVAKEIARAVRNGLHVETTTDIESVRNGLGSCTACDDGERAKAKAAPVQGSLPR